MKFGSPLIAALLLGCAQSNGPVSLADFQSNMKIWDFDKGFGPVYYGSVRKASDASAGPPLRCLALAFVRLEGGRAYYVHKAWKPDTTGCRFGDLTSMEDSLKAPKCFKEGATAKTRAMTPDALSITRTPGNHFRQLDLSEKRAGSLEKCADGTEPGAAEDAVEPAALDVMSITYDDGYFTMLAGKGPIKLRYTLDLDFVDVFQRNAIYPDGLPR